MVLVEGGEVDLDQPVSHYITTSDETVDVKFTIRADGDVHVKIGRQLKTLMDRASFSDGFLSGTSYGTIPSSDAEAHSHTVSYKVLLDGNRLSDYLTTGFTTRRSYGNFSSYIVLEWVNSGS